MITTHHFLVRQKKGFAIKLPRHKTRNNAKSIKMEFTKALGKANISMAIGFALCQLWVSLCFFTPQLFPENASTNVYAISLVVGALCLLPCIRFAKRYETLLERKAVVYLLALCASFGTVIIPFSAQGMLSNVLQFSAGFLTGIASSGLSVAWYQACCKARDVSGLLLSFMISSFFMYLLTTLAPLHNVSPWILTGVICTLPFISVFLLMRSPRVNDYVTEARTPRKGSIPSRVLLHLCVGIFVISFVDEFMRNCFLQGTDLQFYSGAPNLILLVIKIICTVVLLAMVSDYKHGMSLIYRASFLLTMIAVLYMPYIKHIPALGYGIVNFSAFLFKAMVMAGAFIFCQRYRTAPVIVFSLMRIAFSLDLLLGFSVFNIYLYFSPGIEDLLGLLAATMGVMVLITYLFVFAKGNTPLFLTEDTKYTTHAYKLQDKCNRLTRLGGLSKRESEILFLIAKGRSTPRIQEELQLSMNTVNTHTSHVYQKLSIHSRQELLDLLEEIEPEDRTPSEV